MTIQTNKKPMQASLRLSGFRVKRRFTRNARKPESALSPPHRSKSSHHDSITAALTTRPLTLTPAESASAQSKRTRRIRRALTHDQTRISHARNPSRLDFSTLPANARNCHKAEWRVLLIFWTATWRPNSLHTSCTDSGVSLGLHKVCTPTYVAQILHRFFFLPLPTNAQRRLDIIG
jgi:hypothetical protein